MWLITSPMLSVQTISVFGATNAQVSAVLESEDVVDGRPLIVIRSGSVAEALESDPWVRSGRRRADLPLTRGDSPSKNASRWRGYPSARGGV